MPVYGLCFDYVRGEFLMNELMIADLTVDEARELYKVLELHQNDGFTELRFTEVINLLTRAKMICGDISRAKDNSK